ncbi:MAG: hypothetical protein MR038_08165 [Oscillospiraceae bacterium]|nr:hypothetical protein [Oscillospiraceae bacterium]
MISRKRVIIGVRGDFPKRMPTPVRRTPLSAHIFRRFESCSDMHRTRGWVTFPVKEPIIMERYSSPEVISSARKIRRKIRPAPCRIGIPSARIIRRKFPPVGMLRR